MVRHPRGSQIVLPLLLPLEVAAAAVLHMRTYAPGEEVHLPSGSYRMHLTLHAT